MMIMSGKGHNSGSNPKFPNLRINSIPSVTNTIRDPIYRVYLLLLDRFDSSERDESFGVYDAANRDDSHEDEY